MSTTPVTPGLAAMQVAEPGQPLNLVHRALTATPPGHVRVDVAATGMCHADIGTARARGKGVTFPVTPGHEAAGTIAEIGEGVTSWESGNRVAVGWFGGSCGQCTYCRRGDVVHCPQRKIPGLSYPGGWAQTITVPADALARIPDGMAFTEAAPMGCAGVTTFNALREASVPAGGTVAVFGIGGLGHLAIQFAAKMGYRVVTIARGEERTKFAHQLGAHHYIDSTAEDPGTALAALGAADLILCTAPTTGPLEGLLHGLAIRGRLTIIGVDAASLSIPVGQLVMNGQLITGHLTGSALDTEEAMRFAQLNDVKPMTEQMPLAQANEALTRLAAGEARFRIVLDPTDAP
ncbi:alcohol dehydrogenase catalytic domain-containing protein [Arthrobacter sp. SAFR-044]|uniref:alcohol dehydrogenase catalytic domain-containing protein n=1 Tax=Arthrobacter sp. SAFR-044 TaxID=3387278 RepID=UPI003F7CC01F